MGHGPRPINDDNTRRLVERLDRFHNWFWPPGSVARCLEGVDDDPFVVDVDGAPESIDDRLIWAGQHWAFPTPVFVWLRDEHVVIECELLNKPVVLRRPRVDPSQAIDGLTIEVPEAMPPR